MDETLKEINGETLIEIREREERELAAINEEKKLASLVDTFFQNSPHQDYFEGIEVEDDELSSDLFSEEKEEREDNLATEEISFIDQIIYRKATNKIVSELDAYHKSIKDKIRWEAEASEAHPSLNIHELSLDMYDELYVPFNRRRSEFSVLLLKPEFSFESATREVENTVKAVAKQMTEDLLTLITNRDLYDIKDLETKVDGMASATSEIMSRIYQVEQYQEGNFEDV